MTEYNTYLCKNCKVEYKFMYASGNKYAFGECPLCYAVTRITKEQFKEREEELKENREIAEELSK